MSTFRRWGGVSGAADTARPPGARSGAVGPGSRTDARRAPERDGTAPRRGILRGSDVNPTPERIGIVVIDKPAGITSHDVVDQVRRRFGTRRVGHLGTLDPIATGVLPVTVGKATRLARFIPDSSKEYTGRIRLGRATTTGDAEGEPLGDDRPVTLRAGRLEAAMAAFQGRIRQIPPAFSAKKIDGVPAHRLARRGVEVEMKPSEVVVELFELVRWDPPELEFRVVCSPGTYIRSLARDLGAELGTGGHVVALRRTRSGPFTVQEAIAPGAAGPENLIAPAQALRHLPAIEVDDDGADRVRHGRAVRFPEARGDGGEALCIFNKRGKLIAVATSNEGWANPKVVLL